MLWPNHDISGRNVALTNQLRACNVCIKRVPSYVVVRPGYTLLSRLPFSFLFLALCLVSFSEYLFASLLLLSPYMFPFLWFVVSLFCYFSLIHFHFHFTFLCFFVFPFSLFHCIGVAGVCMLWHGIVLLVLLFTLYHVL